MGCWDNFVTTFKKQHDLSVYTAAHAVDSAYLKPLNFFILRIITWTWLVSTWFYIWINGYIQSDRVDYPIYLTHQTYMMLVVHYSFYLFMTIYHHNMLTKLELARQTGQSATIAEIYASAPHFNIFQRFFVVLWHLISCYCPLVTLAYWVLLASEYSNNGSYNNIAVHVCNAIVAIMEIIFNRMPHQSTHIFYCICCYGFYYIIQDWIYYAAGGPWVYSFLNYYKGTFAVWFFILFFLLTLFHFAANLFINKLRDAKYNATHGIAAPSPVGGTSSPAESEMVKV